MERVIAADAGLLGKVAGVPGRVVDVCLPHNSAIADALREAGVDSSGCSVTVNGEGVGLDRAVEALETILVVNQHIRGASGDERSKKA